MKMVVYSKVRQLYMNCEVTVELDSSNLAVTVTNTDTKEVLFWDYADSFDEALKAFQKQLQEEEAHL